MGLGAGEAALTRAQFWRSGRRLLDQERMADHGQGTALASLKEGDSRLARWSKRSLRGPSVGYFHPAGLDDKRAGARSLTVQDEKGWLSFDELSSEFCAQLTSLAGRMGSENRSPALRYWAITNLNNARARPRNSVHFTATTLFVPRGSRNGDAKAVERATHTFMRRHSHPGISGSACFTTTVRGQKDAKTLGEENARRTIFGGGTGSLKAIERVSSLLARQARSPTRRELQFNQTRDAANAQSAGSRFFFARHAVMARRRVASPTTLKSPPVPARRHRRVIQRFIDWEVAWTDRRSV
ncbi:hypothetical protein CPLU01_02068 [Colletotrichum plurivorum]|uniref:Uncharacterized protein n=1 Tax=Colletotrichum plurivorum TaxID=2175906 RepID=A0A8H6KWQ1_9PEZI|nr:hypothetical protein CPLU01_02068 [Colletotrichum plurivorum]